MGTSGKVGDAWRRALEYFGVGGTAFAQARRAGDLELRQEVADLRREVEALRQEVERLRQRA